MAEFISIFRAWWLPDTLLVVVWVGAIIVLTMLVSEDDG